MDVESGNETSIFRLSDWITPSFGPTHRNSVTNRCRVPSLQGFRRENQTFYVRAGCWRDERNYAQIIPRVFGLPRDPALAYDKSLGK
ncbi:hypothetical protein NDU88_002372 [Pleurodeles waltl]|uniref:Uncharacterized protein n=1 Tax=Pleurodeles waltl TaxID=8319 RepID=A0AAV7RBN3_PLEWA|nr:hypothetical protein NDU88_002372 [Pleurodeles waltl]